jgi:hypothetical protein
VSCYEEFEIQCDLAGISKIDVLKEIGHKANGYYFFVSNDGIFNWFDFEGNYVKDPGVLKTLDWNCIPLVITKCIIPNSITSIGHNSFRNCESLTSITIPDNVTSIGNNAFVGCKSLKSISIPNSVTNIGYNVFYNCTSLKEVIFKGRTLDEVKRIKYYPFEIEDESIIKCEV